MCQIITVTQKIGPQVNQFDTVSAHLLEVLAWKSYNSIFLIRTHDETPHLSELLLRHNVVTRNSQ
jgi:hypothetical protein